MFAEVHESLLDKLELPFRIVLGRYRNVAVRRRTSPSQACCAVQSIQRSPLR